MTRPRRVLFGHTQLSRPAVRPSVNRRSAVRRCVDRWAKGCLTLLAVGVCHGPVRMARADVTPDQIEQAIAKGKKYLFSQMHGANWEKNAQPPDKGEEVAGLPGQWGGETAICVYTLLAAGESYQDERMKKAIEWLGNAEKMTGIYAVGMRANVWNQIDERLRRKPPYSLAIERDMDILLKAVKTRNPSTSGMFDYHKNNTPRIDHSVSQYGVLGMWAIADSETGQEIPGAFWKVVEEGWIRDQEKLDVEAYTKLPTDKRAEVTAGWGYENGRPSGGGAKPGGRGATASMTAAGVASLFITQDQLHTGEGLDCQGNIFNPHIEAGLNWLAKNFGQVQGNYTWYGIERIGVASGRKYFGTVDWFKQGAEHLVKSQAPSGGWGPEHGSNVANTCFAIMFLERGRSPVIMNKLQYSIFTNGDTHKEASWNERARDVANLAKHAWKATEQFLNWQVVNLQVAPEELHDAPILYISGGKEGLFFSPEEEAKIKKFVEEGGLIVGNADCGSGQFANSFRKLGTKLFGNEFRKLDISHLIYHENGDPQKSYVAMEALSNGARELMVLFPAADPARLWQAKAFAGKEQFHNVALNIFLYTTETLKPRTKGETYLVKRDAAPATRSLKLARLKFTAAEQVWNPEPYGWERMANILHNNDRLDLTAESVELGTGKLDPKTYKVAHLTGVYGIVLNDKQRAELKEYVTNGGTLIIDACGGTPKVVADVQKELATLFPDESPQILPPASPVFHSARTPADSVAYRSFAAKQLTGNTHLPRVQAINVNGRPAVLFSPEDLSVGLVGQTVDGIIGYSAQPTKDKEGKVNHVGASEVMENLVMFAAGGGKPVAAAAAKPAGESPTAKAAKPAPKSNKKQ